MYRPSQNRLSASREGRIKPARLSAAERPPVGKSVVESAGELPRTQVSLLPPPVSELMMIESGELPARAKAPGITTYCPFPAAAAYNRSIKCRGCNCWFCQVGAVESE